MTRWLSLCVAVALLVAGCALLAHSPTPDPVSAASEGVAGVVAHTESAERHVQNAIPHADPTGQVQLQAASDEHKEVLSDAAETKAALSAATAQIDALNDNITQQKLRYQKLEGQWYVTWGRRIERALWIIGITWLVLGIASVLLGVGNPLGWGMSLGREIVRLVPAMNLFAWVRDWIIARRSTTGG